MRRVAFKTFLATALVAIGLVPAINAQDKTDRKKTETSRSESQVFLGIGVTPLPAALTSQLPDVLGSGQGVLIAEVTKGSPAEKAGLQPNDILVSYDQQKVFSPEQLVKLVRNDKPGHEVKIAYVRGGKLQEATIKLGQTPARQTAGRRTALRLPLIDRFTSGGGNPGGQSATEATQQQGGTPWTTFKSLTIVKLDNNRYRAEIDFHDKDRKAIHRKYEGTREELRKAIEADKELPADERAHLLRSLDQQSPDSTLPAVFRDLEQFERELFNWPNLDF